VDRIQDEYVETTPLLDGRRDRSAQRLEVSEVRFERQRPHAKRPGFSSGSLETAFDDRATTGVGVIATLTLARGTCSEGDIEPGSAEGEHACFANTAARAGDQGNRTIVSAHLITLSAG
jgi:hypothetical protein